MHKYEQESRKLGKQSFMYAWVLDETGEERNRGITMDVGRSQFETKTKHVTLLDAPGHKDFIPNMISGAGQADVALLVVDATRGEFETGFDFGGQTREHALLVRSLGVTQLAVAINKLDTVSWSKERFDEISQKLKTFLKQAGFREGDVTFVPCSGLTGQNLTSKPTENELLTWYSGPCLLEVIGKVRNCKNANKKYFEFR
jgi:elongation factor 1 alpha-like protein